jgi:predicted metal-binding protein
MKKTTLNETEAPVSQALILICEKCGKGVSGSEAHEQNPSRLLQKELKEAINQRFGKKVARAVVSTCMNICPEKQIAVGFCQVQKGSEFFTFADENRAQVKEEILNKISLMLHKS